MNYDRRVIDGILSGEAESLRFVSAFWAFTPVERDKEQFLRFCKFVRNDVVSMSLDDVSASVGIHRTTVLDWRNGTSLPFLARIYRKYVASRKLRQGYLWLPLRIARNGSAFERLIQVPKKVHSERDINDVLKQLSSKNIIREFAFLLGVMLGDAGKGMNLYANGEHRLPSFNLVMSLTRRHKSNERFAQYTAHCCSSLGLAMYRIKDKPPSEKQLKSLKSMNYAWTSERSPLLAWMHMACLGLGIRETTTKNPVRMEWALKSSRIFRVSFLQGVGESDGSASYNGYARIETWPNAPFIANLIRSLGVTCSYAKKGDRLSGVSITIDQAASLPLFNKEIASERFLRMRLMTEARRLHSWKPEIQLMVNELSKSMKAPDITRKLLREYNIFIRPGSINRYLRRLNLAPFLSS